MNIEERPPRRDVNFKCLQGQTIDERRFQLLRDQSIGLYTCLCQFNTFFPVLLSQEQVLMVFTPRKNNSIVY